jgi:hypothetical protein
VQQPGLSTGQATSLAAGDDLAGSCRHLGCPGLAVALSALVL